VGDALGSLGFNVTIDVFAWSGANSIFERRRASRELASRLNEHSRGADRATQVVIGHSHGGTVMMLACRDLADDVRPHLISLATPFVELATDPPPFSWLRPVTELAMTLAGLFVFWLVSRPAAGAQALLAGIATYMNFRVAVSLYAAALVTAWVLLTFGFLRLLISGHRRLEALIDASKEGLMHFKSLHMLVVRGVDDEAGLTLAAAAIANRISFLFFKLIGGLSGLLTVVAVVRYGVTSVSTIALMICLASFIPLLLAGISKSCVGRELLYGSLSFHIKSHSTPDQIDGMSVITLSPAASDGFLRHSIHSHEEVVALIAGWIRKQVIENPVLPTDDKRPAAPEITDASRETVDAGVGRREET
jgi:hypothetical protein